MKLCVFDPGSMLFAALDFIEGYPAVEGKLVSDPYELVVDKEGNTRQNLGRLRCLGYTVAHALSIPISPLIAAVRSLVMPIFFGMLLISVKPGDRLEMSKYLFVEWMIECTSVVTSPLSNIVGVGRAGLGVFMPNLYLKAPYVSQLSESQRFQAAVFMHDTLSPQSRL